MRRLRSLVAFALAGSLASGCSDTPSNPDPGEPRPEPTTIPELIVSEAPSVAELDGAAEARSGSAVAYVSLPPGTRPAAVVVRLRNLTTGGNPTAPVPVLAGGFDPVTLAASAGDRLELRFTDGTGAVTVDYATVLLRLPVIVRTAPSTGRTDVALLVRPIVVFSEPVDPATLPTGVRLVTNGEPVDGHPVLLPAQPWIAEFVPDSPLVPATSYELQITQAIRAVDGGVLEAPLTAEFTTQTSTTLPGGASITVTTTGEGIDTDGYDVVADGTDRGAIPVNGTMVLQLEPGTRVIALSGLAPNCAVDGPTERAVIVIESQIAPVEFTVRCTQTSEAIEVVVTASGTDRAVIYEAVLDGVEHPAGLTLDLTSGSGRLTLRPVAAGDHVLALRPYQRNCTVENSPRSLTVPSGGQARVTFAVSCVPNLATLRITAATTGSLPSSTQFRAMHGNYDYWGYGTDTYTYLGDVEPNGTLVAQTPAQGEAGYPYWNIVYLSNVPAKCTVSGEDHAEEHDGLGSFALRFGDVIDVEFTVTCPP